MYYKLFNEITDTINRLQLIQELTEELYVNDSETEILEIKRQKEKMGEETDKDKK